MITHSFTVSSKCHREITDQAKTQKPLFASVHRPALTVQYKSVLCVFKALNGLAPAYVVEMLHPSESLRSASR